VAKLVDCRVIASKWRHSIIINKRARATPTDLRRGRWKKKYAREPMTRIITKYVVDALRPPRIRYDIVGYRPCSRATRRARHVIPSRVVEKRQRPWPEILLTGNGKKNGRSCRVRAIAGRAGAFATVEIPRRCVLTNANFPQTIRGTLTWFLTRSRYRFHENRSQTYDYNIITITADARMKTRVLLRPRRSIFMNRVRRVTFQVRMRSRADEFQLPS